MGNKLLTDQYELIEPPAGPTTSVDTAISATSSAEMAAANRQLGAFFLQQLHGATRDLEAAERELVTAEALGFRVSPIRAEIAKHRRRAEFYEKAALAAAAGLTPFPYLWDVEVFAVRVEGEKPSRRSWRERSRANADSRQPREEAGRLIAGVGDYVDARLRTAVESRGGIRDAEEYPFRSVVVGYQDIDFPASMRSVACMEAVTAAMGLLVFDDLVVSPGRAKSKQDPLVLGRIRHWRGRSRVPLCFLIAWHLDPRSID